MPSADACGDTGLSQAELLIIALGRLQSACPGPVPLSQIVVAAWKLDRAKLGLEGWEDEHPDTNRSTYILSKPHGPVARGLIDRPFPRMYDLTVWGMLTAQELEDKLEAGRHIAAGVAR